MSHIINYTLQPYNQLHINRLNNPFSAAIRRPCERVHAASDGWSRAHVTRGSHGSAGRGAR